MYTPYVTASEYTSLGYTDIPSTLVDKYLINASHDIDTLTFNRIIAKGINSLTSFQVLLIKDVCCMHAEFLYNNADALASIFDAYSINGVSMKFGTGFSVIMENGVPMQSKVYSLLKQTGLCWRGAK